jgi:hypothetical protein
VITDLGWKYFIKFMFRNNKKCINSYQFIISLCCCYMFRQLVPSSGSSSVPPELNASLDFWLIKFSLVCGCICYVAA